MIKKKFKQIIFLFFEFLFIVTFCAHKEKAEILIVHGVWSCMRDSFSLVRKNGTIHLSIYLRIFFKINNYVDIKQNGAIHKGMSREFYDGHNGHV